MRPPLLWGCLLFCSVLLLACHVSASPIRRRKEEPHQWVPRWRPPAADRQHPPPHTFQDNDDIVRVPVARGRAFNPSPKAKSWDPSPAQSAHGMAHAFYPPPNTESWDPSPDYAPAHSAERDTQKCQPGMRCAPAHSLTVLPVSFLTEQGSWTCPICRSRIA